MKFRWTPIKQEIKKIRPNAVIRLNCCVIKVRWRFYFIVLSVSIRFSSVAIISAFQPSNIKIHAKFIRMRPHSDRVDFVVALVANPVVNHVRSEHVAGQEEIVVFFQGVECLVQ